MTQQTVFHDSKGRVRCVENGESKASVHGCEKAESDTDTHGKLTTRHIVTVTDGVVTDAELQPESEPTTADWLRDIAATRYDHEVAGTKFTHSDGNTYGIATDRQSQALTTGAAVQARRAQEAGNSDWSKRWKTAQGFVTMTADDILAMGDAVDAHVQACFDREAELVAMVAEGSITELDLETGWTS